MLPRLRVTGGFLLSYYRCLIVLVYPAQSGNCAEHLRMSYA